MPSRLDYAVADGAAEQDDEGQAEGEPRLGQDADDGGQDQTTLKIYIELLPRAQIRTPPSMDDESRKTAPATPAPFSLLVVTLRRSVLSRTPWLLPGTPTRRALARSASS
jgi:hypothetical protein